jgi:hypothetical protein
VVVGGSVVGEVLENRAVGALEQRERFVEHTPLEVGFVRRAEWSAELEGDPEESRESHRFGLFADE